MSRLLYVSSSPLNDRSFSGRIADAFVQAWRAANPDGEVDTLNVWAEPLPAFDAEGASWKLGVMAGQAPTAAESAVFEQVQLVANRFKAADKYLFSVPMWNFNIPYRLKHFIDVVVQPGLTVGFDPARGFYGLVPNRPVQLVLSRGGTYAVGQPMAPMDFQRPYLEGILGFIGLTDVRAITMECTGYGPGVSDPLLDAAIAEARAAGTAF